MMPSMIATLLLCSLSAVCGTVSQIKLAQGMDPTSMTVTWSTMGTVSGNTQVIYGTTKTYLTMLGEGSEGKAYTFQSFDNSKLSPAAKQGMYFPKYTSPLIHTVRLNNLAPGTKYYYRCGDTVSGDLSAIISFTTLPAVGSAMDAQGRLLTFAILADTSVVGTVNGTTYTGFMNTTITNIMANPAIGMVLLPGDLNYADCNAPVWDLWDNQNAPLTQTTPFMVSAGNHEQEQEPVTGKTYTAFEARYNMPKYAPATYSAIVINSVPFTNVGPNFATFKCQNSIFNSGYDYGNSFYSFNAGLAHVIFLNAYTNYVAGSNQYKWLLQDLMKVDRTMTPWILVNFHTPWYNTYKGKHNELESFGMKKAMEALFYQYHVNAAFSGHVHAYERFLPMYNNVTTNNATIYMTVGTGGQSADGNKFVGVGSLTSQEPYNSVSTRTGTIYGFGTFTINSATVATWMMLNNTHNAPIVGSSSIDTVLICNTFNTGSAICPYTSIPVSTDTTTYVFAQIISGVTLAQAQSPAFQTAFIASIATTLAISPSVVIIKSVTLVVTRRLSELRELTASSSVKMSYSVTSPATAATVTSSIANSAAALATNLNAVGGFTASVASATVDYTTPSPTSAPTPSPTAAPSTATPTPAPTKVSVIAGTVSQIKLAQGMDPTSMTVTWSTNGTVSGNTQVIYGTSKTSLTMLGEGSEGKAYTFQSFDNSKLSPAAKQGMYFPMYTSPLIHSVRLNNLAPGTKYYYRCGDTVSGALSPIISFTTLPAVGTAMDAQGRLLTFAILADTSTSGTVNGTTYTGFMNQTVANIMANPAIGMVLLPGDLNYADCNAPVWDLWDNQNAPLTQTTPFMVSAGNHEQEQEPVTGKTYTAFEARYNMPKYAPATFSAITLNGAAFKNPNKGANFAAYKCQSSIFNSGYDYGNSFYSFNAGLAHVIFMNAYTNYVAGSNQYKWLLQDLMKVDRTMTPWILVNFHTPWYNTFQGKHNELESFGMKKAMEALFYKYHVNAAFSGHIHGYERFLPMYNNVTTNNATIYMTVGTGGQSYDGNNYVTTGSGVAQEPYVSVISTRTGSMYGFGTFTINSATVATWIMLKNTQSGAVAGTTPVESLLICNTFNTGSAICPYTSIPVSTTTTTYVFGQTITGVTLAQAQSPAFQTAFIASIAATLGIDISMVKINSVTAGVSRRLSELRSLGSSSSVKMGYSVTSAASVTTVTSSITNSGSTLATNLNTAGFAATVASPTLDTSTPTPTSAPVLPPTILSGSCFAGSETVAMESGDVKFISEVKVGDRVLAATAAGVTLYSEVVYVPHGANKDIALFAQITTESGRDVKMTMNHILPSGVCGSALPLMYASEVSVGDCIQTVSGEEKLSMVGTVRGEGVYTIVTKEEFIVVNGIIASPFGANHMMANMYYNVHRFMYTVSPMLLASSLLHAANEALGFMIPLFGSI